MAEINDLMRRNGRSFSGLVSGTMVLNGYLHTLEAKIAAKEEEDGECMSVSELAEEISSLSISTPPISATFASPSSVGPLEDEKAQVQSLRAVDPSSVLPLELLIQILQYIPLSFRSAIQLESLNHTWRDALRSISHFWHNLDLRSLDWLHTTPQMLREYVKAANGGVKIVQVDWVLRNDFQKDKPMNTAITAYDALFDERWYELVWWISTLYKAQQSVLSAAQKDFDACVFEITPCVPFLSRHRPTQNDMLAVQWGPVERFPVPQAAVEQLVCMLAYSKNRPGNLQILRIQRRMLLLERWDGGMEAPWERQGFEYEE